MNVAYINPFILAIHQVFDKMVHVSVTLGKPFLRTLSDGHYSVSAVVDLNGAVSGSVVLRLTQNTALALASGLAGTPVVALDADCLDALGEIVNMVAGSAKKDLSEKQTSTAIPKVFVGSPRQAPQDQNPVIIIPCESRVGRFALEVNLRESPVAA